MKLDSVVIDLVLEERNLFCANMLLWDREEFYPYKTVPSAKPSLRINLLASIPRKSFEDKVRAIYVSTQKVKHCFSELLFSYPDYREPNKTVNTDSTISFINSISGLGSGNFLRLNVACLALRTGWLVAIESDSIGSETWIEGASYDGVSETIQKYESAIHHCGLYRISETFSKFILKTWKPIVEKYSVLSDTLNPIEMLYKALDDSTFSSVDVSEFQSKFVNSNHFANHDGPYENKHYDGVALRRLLRDPFLVIGISKHLFRELETIDISYADFRKTVRQYFKANQI